MKNSNNNLMVNTFNETEKKNISSKIDPSLIIDKIGGVNNPFQAIVEAIDNSCDSGATKINVNFDNIDNVMTINDNGSGIESKRLEHILDYGFGDKRDNTIGYFNIGMKSIAPFFTNPSMTKQILMEIDTVCNGERTIINKKYDINNPIDYLNSTITTFPSNNSKNGTTIKLNPVFIEIKEWDKIKLMIAARYSELIRNKKIIINIDGIVLEPIDMFYSTYPESLLAESIIKCKDEEGEFDVKVAVYDTMMATKVESSNGGARNVIKERLNKLDEVEGVTTRESFRGVYCKCNDVYITLGGANNSLKKHFGFAANTVSNGVRVMVEIPDSRKHFIYFPFKTETNKGLKDFYFGKKRVFDDVIKFVKKNNPTVIARKETKEDKNKIVRKRLFEKRDDIKFNINELHNLINDTSKNVNIEMVNKYINNLKNIMDYCA